MGRGVEGGDVCDFARFFLKIDHFWRMAIFDFFGHYKGGGVLCVKDSGYIINII